MHTKFYSEHLNIKDHLDDQGVDGCTILQQILKE